MSVEEIERRLRSCNEGLNMGGASYEGQRSRQERQRQLGAQKQLEAATTPWAGGVKGRGSWDLGATWQDLGLEGLRERQGCKLEYSHS